jgi:DNA-binding response OmpR family regulator
VGTDGSGTIVVVEDDANIADLVDLYLRRDGFRVILAADGERGLAAVARDEPRLVILDVGLPGGMDGLEVCRRIRQKAELPIIILTARDGEVDRILGLELGADDYVTKPFSPRELVARVRAILRRAERSAPPDTGDRPPVVAVGAVEVDGARREARVGGVAVPLAAQEFELLAFLADNVGLALTRRQMLDGAWGPEWYGDERIIDVYVRQLRKKLGDALPLTTVWGVGYRLA